MNAVILHYADYRGDHSADSRKILMLHPDTTLQELLEIVHKESGSRGAAWIEIAPTQEIEP